MCKMKKNYVVIFSFIQNMFELTKSKMAAVEFWKSNSADIFATKCDRNMNNISFFYVFRQKEVDSAVIFDETHPQNKISHLQAKK